MSNDVDVLPCDTNYFGASGIRLHGHTVGVIAQVKSGKYKIENVIKCFCDKYLFYCIRRLGIVPQAEVEGIVKTLRTKASIHCEKTVICKVLIHTKRYALEPPTIEAEPAWLSITLEKIEEFIHERFESYWQHKSGSRMFFSDPLVQYFAWKVGRKIEV